MNDMQDIDLDHEGEKAARGFKTAAIVVVIGVIAAVGEGWRPGTELPPVDAMRTEFLATPYTPASGTPYTPSPEALQAMEQGPHIEAF